MKKWPAEFCVCFWVWRIALTGLITQNQHLQVQKIELGTVGTIDMYRETFAGKMVYKGGLNE